MFSRGDSGPHGEVNRLINGNLKILLRGSCIGFAQTPEQSGPNHLSLDTPVEGLFFVGADAGSRGIGTKLAVGSAINLSNRL